MTSEAALEKGLRQALIEDISNQEDGAGSDLEYVDATELYGVFVEVHGNLDVAALANTAIAYIRENS